MLPGNENHQPHSRSDAIARIFRHPGLWKQHPLLMRTKQKRLQMGQLSSMILTMAGPKTLKKRFLYHLIGPTPSYVPHVRSQYRWHILPARPRSGGGAAPTVAPTSGLESGY